MFLYVFSNGTLSTLPPLQESRVVFFSGLETIDTPYPLREEHFAGYFYVSHEHPTYLGGSKRC